VVFGVTQLLKVEKGENVDVQRGSLSPVQPPKQQEASFKSSNKQKVIKIFKVKIMYEELKQTGICFLRNKIEYDLIKDLRKKAEMCFIISTLLLRNLKFLEKFPLFKAKKSF
jgi:hypothetical protein